MSKIVSAFNTFVTGIFDLLLMPFRGLSPVAGLIFISVISGFLLVFLYGRLSNQKALRQVKDTIYGALLEAVLFRRHTSMALRAQARMFVSGAKYFLLAVPPILVLSIPCIIIMAQLNLRYGHHPLPEGKTAIISATLASDLDLKDIRLEADPGISVETPPVRINGQKQAYWRVRALEEGKWSTRIGGETALPLYTGTKANIAPGLRTSSWWWEILYPGAEALPWSGKLREIAVVYPEASYSLPGFNTSWIVIFLVVSILGGIIWSRLWGIEI